MNALGQTPGDVIRDLEDRRKQLEERLRDASDARYAAAKQAGYIEEEIAAIDKAIDALMALPKEELK